MKEIGKIMVTALLAAAMSVSCARDLGNYTYTELDGPAVSGVAENYEVLTMERLSIAPSVSGGLGEEAYTYEWKVIDNNNDNAETVLSQTRNLSCMVTLTPGSYTLYYTMTEKESGIMWQTVSSLTVNSSMSAGWMILCSDGGAARLDFISAITGQTYSDVLAGYRDEGMPDYHGPRRIQWLSSKTDEASPYYLLTDDGATRLGKNSFEWSEEYSLVYESGAGIDLAPYSIVCSGIGKMAVSGTDAYYCEILGVSGLYGSAVNNGFEAAPAVGANVLANSIYAAVYLLYDTTHGKFMAYCPLLDDIGGYETLLDMEELEEIAEEQTSGKDGASGTVVTEAFDYPSGYGYVYMENTLYDPGNASMGVTYTILSDGDRRYVYGLQCGDMLVYGDCTFVLGKALFADISGCTDIASPGNLYAFSSLHGYLYYAVGDSVYRADLDAEPVTSQLQFSLPGETVTCLKFNLYQNPDNRQECYDLVVGSETDGGVGTLRIYEGYDSDGDFTGASPAETWTGFSRIVDATYKEMVY